jgi:hypothetical protein
MLKSKALLLSFSAFLMIGGSFAHSSVTFTHSVYTVATLFKHKSISMMTEYPISLLSMVRGRLRSRSRSRSHPFARSRSGSMVQKRKQTFDSLVTQSFADFSLSLGSGQHHIGVFAVGYDGMAQHKSFNITVQ